MAEEMKTFGLDNNDIKGSMFKKFQAKQNQIDRAGLVYTDPKAMFAGARVHFKDRYFYCKKSICCEKLKEPKWRIGAVMVRYSTDNLANLRSPFGYEIIPWFFSEQTYNKLRTADSEFPLAAHDIKISCTNEEYQHLQINCCRESIWQAKAELKEKVLAEAKSCWEWMKKSIANDLSVEEIKDLIAGAQAGGPAADPTHKMNLDDILKSV